MITTAAKLLALVAALSVGVGSRGPVKYSNVTLSKVRKSYWSVSVTYPRFQGATPVTTVANQQLLKFCQSSVHEWATRDTKDMEKPQSPWLQEVTPTVVTAWPDLVSLQMTQYSDTEGAHPNTFLMTLNFGLVGAIPKRLTLNDLFKPGTQPLAAVSKIVMAKLKSRDASSVVNGNGQKPGRPNQAISSSSSRIA